MDKRFLVLFNDATSTKVTVQGRMENESIFLNSGMQEVCEGNR